MRSQCKNLFARLKAQPHLKLNLEHFSPKTQHLAPTILTNFPGNQLLKFSTV